MVTFTDDFNRADSTNNLGNGWTGFTTTYSIVANQAAPAGTGTRCAKAPVSPTTRTVYAEATYSALVSGTFTGVAVALPATLGSAASTTGAAYVLWATGSPPNTISIRYKPAGGNVTSMTGGTGTPSTAYAWQPGDRMRLEADLNEAGDVVMLRGYVNGGLLVSYVPAAAQTVTGGQKGVGLYTGTASTSQRFDDFAGGDVETPVEFYTTTRHQGPATVQFANEDKAQSKVWRVGAAWHGILHATASPYFEIRRFDGTSWVATGATYDDDPAAHADALWDQASQTLYVLSVTTTTMKLWKWTWDGAAYTSVISGLQIGTTGSETATLALDSLGRLWLARTTAAAAVEFAHSTTDHATWTAPAVVPGSPTLNADDICAIVAFSGRIGIVWSNQVSTNEEFAWHTDTDPDTAWTLETAAMPAGGADDHVNIKEYGGRLFVAMKRLDDSIALVHRSTAGVWSEHVIAGSGFSYTRPQCVVDATNERVLVFWTRIGGGDLWMSHAPLSDLNAWSTRTKVIDSGFTGVVDDVSVSKQAWTTTGEGVALVATSNVPYTYWTVLAQVPGVDPPPTGAAAGTWTATGAAAGATGRRGQATGAWAAAGSASGRKPSGGAAAGTWTAAGAAVGAAGRRGTSVGAWTAAGTTAGRTTRSGAATEAWTVVGSGAGVTSRRGAATGVWTASGAAAGARTPRASAIGAWTTVGAAAGRKVPEATAGAAWSATGSAAGSTTRRGTGTGSWTSTGTSAGARPSAGTAAGSWAAVGSAGGSTTRRGSGSGSWAAAGSAAGSRPVNGSAAGTYTAAGAAAGTATPRGSATGSWSAAGSAAGVAPLVDANQGSATGAWSATGSATGATSHRGSGAGAWATAGIAAGAKAPQGSAGGAWQVEATTAGAAGHAGAAAADWTVTGSAAGSAPTVAGASGSAVGVWSTTGTAAGTTARGGAGAGAWTGIGTASGTTAHTGAGAGAWSAGGAAVGAAPRRGSTTGSWTVAGAAQGRASHAGAAAGTWTTIGAAAGASTRAGTATGSWVVAGAAAGGAPGLPPGQGQATGVWVISGAAGGTKAPAGTAIGTYTAAGAAAGATARRGAATGTWTITGAGTGIDPAGFRDITVTVTGPRPTARTLTGPTARTLTAAGPRTARSLR